MLTVIQFNLRIYIVTRKCSVNTGTTEGVKMNCLRFFIFAIIHKISVKLMTLQVGSSTVEFNIILPSV